MLSLSRSFAARPQRRPPEGRSDRHRSCGGKHKPSVTSALAGLQPRQRDTECSTGAVRRPCPGRGPCWTHDKLLWVVEQASKPWSRRRPLADWPRIPAFVHICAGVPCQARGGWLLLVH